MATPTYDPIASTTLTSSASSVTFSSLDTIAAGYRDLVLVAQLKATGNIVLGYRLNGDTGSNYSYVVMAGNGSSAVSTSSTETYGRISRYSTPNANDWTMVKLQVMDFDQSNKHKSTLTRTDMGYETSAGYAATEAFAGRWASTSAVTSLSIGSFAANQLAAGSVFSLFGIVA